MKTIKYALIVLMALTIAACGKKPTEYVAPLVQFEPTATVNTAWTASVGGGNQKEYLKLNPTLHRGQIYTATHSGQISGVDTQSGKRTLSVSIKQPISTGVGVDDARLYVGTRSAEVVAINRQDGSIAWRTSVSNEVLATPNAQTGLVIVRSIDDHVYALNKKTGRVVWSYRQPAPEMILRESSSPQVSGNVAAIGFADGSVSAFNSQNGGMLWSNMIARPRGMSAVEQMVDIDNSIAISNGVVYVATYQGAISAVGLHSGNQLWENKMSSYAGLDLDAGKVYVSDAEGYLWAFNRSTGDLIWKQENLKGRGITGPTILGNTVVVADKQGYVHFMSAANGAFVARVRPDASGIIANPVTADGGVYVYTNSGRLVKYTG